MNEPLKNIFVNINKSDDEIFEDIIVNPYFKLERIISTGQSTPKGEWLEQEKDEWVLLLSGSAELLFKGEEKPISMLPGSYILIPAHKEHRVEQTDKNIETVWLAIHY